MIEQKTVGVSPKVPLQAITTIVVFAAAYFGFELPPGAAGAIATLLGIVAGVRAAPGTVINAPAK